MRNAVQTKLNVHVLCETNPKFIEKKIIFHHHILPHRFDDSRRINLRAKFEQESKVGMLNTRWMDDQLFRQAVS